MAKLTENKCSTQGCIQQSYRKLFGKRHRSYDVWGIGRFGQRSRQNQTWSVENSSSFNSPPNSASHPSRSQSLFPPLLFPLSSWTSFVLESYRAYQWKTRDDFDFVYVFRRLSNDLTLTLPNSLPVESVLKAI